MFPAIVPALGTNPRKFTLGRPSPVQHHCLYISSVPIRFPCLIEDVLLFQPISLFSIFALWAQLVCTMDLS